MIIRSIITLAFLSCILSAQAKGTPRQHLTFDADWRFRLCKDTVDVLNTLKTFGITDNPFSATTTPSQTKTKVTDDTEPEQAQVTASEVTTGTSNATSGGVSSWQTVRIPHDWSIALPFDTKIGGSAGYLPGGQGIYVKEFTLPSSIAKTIAQSGSHLSEDGVGRGRLGLSFDGVYHRATVWLNGHKLGYHVYGYTGFEYDITPYINKVGKNTLVVHVNREEQSRWYTGSGIYRHVWLNVTSPTHIRTNSFFVHADENDLVDMSASYDIAPEDSGKTFKLAYTILDHNGKNVNAKTNIRHWSTEDPYMYIARVQLLDSKGKVIDEVRTPFGFRTIRFDADKGFFLNGKAMKLKGMCLHQDCGSLGVAVPEEYWERRLKALKAIGCNAIRCSHNPPSPEFLTICDTLGLLVLDEAFDKWKSGYYKPFFDDCAKQDITDMVLRDRNHPSVIIWSIGNEVSEAWRETNEGVDRARMLNDIVKSLDPTRPTLVACQQGFQDKFGDVTDLVGYNYLEPRMIADHKRHPNRKMLVTEAFVYYSGLRENVVRDFVEENPWHFVEENDFIAGSFVWAGVDYLGESSPWPAKGWCSCPFDMTLKERPQAAYYQANWDLPQPLPRRGESPDQTTEENIHTATAPIHPSLGGAGGGFLKLVVRDNCFDQAMGTDHWQYPPMADTWDLPYKDSRCVQVRCYTTCDSVQFFFPMWSNPQLPLKPRVTKDYPDHCITIQLPARAGKVLAVGYKDGQPVVRDSLINHGDVADVRLDFEGPSTLSTLPKDYTPRTATPVFRNMLQNTVTSLRLTLVDKDGLIQQMQPRTFRVETEGPITLLGVETGDMRRTESWRTTSLKTYFGEGFIRLQSTAPSPQGKGNGIAATARVKVFVEGFDTPFIKEITIQ